MQAMDSLPAEAVSRFAHCDGLVLVASDSTVRVLNPATRRILTLPAWSTSPSSSHPSFGLGRDPWTNAYKVARLWQRTEPKSKSFTGIVYTYHVEVFTIGANQHWRKLVHPPHSIMIGQTATFFKGSLLWIIQPFEPTAVSGFLRLKLWDETFNVVSWPPCGPWFHNEACLSELRGELCVTCPYQNLEMLDMWMCKDVDGADLPRWDKRYTIRWDWARASLPPSGNTW
jgi:F-box interacting protein